MLFGRCDPNWDGVDCSEPTTPLAKQLNDQFTRGATKGLWLRAAGGIASTQCGVLIAGPALHFKAVRIFVDTCHIIKFRLDICSFI